MPETFSVSYSDLCVFAVLWNTDYTADEHHWGKTDRIISVSLIRIIYSNNKPREKGKSMTINAELTRLLLKGDHFSSMEVRKPFMRPKYSQDQVWRSWGQRPCWEPQGWRCRRGHSQHTRCCCPAAGRLSLSAPPLLPECHNREGEREKMKSWILQGLNRV